MKSWSRLDWLIIIIFAALVTLFYWRILTPNPADRQSFPPGDFHAQFWAFATFEVRELSQGRLPLWNPYTFAGAPFWADVQSAVFYPPSLLTVLLSAPWGFSLFALELEAIAHFWLAAVFMYLFIRNLTHSRAAALIAALTFTFSGYLTGYPSQQLAVLEADVWLPLILFFLHRAYKKMMNDERGTMNTKSGQIHHSLFIIHHSSYISLILAGVALGMTLLAGHPQSALIVVYISIAYILFLWLGTRPLPKITHHAKQHLVARIIHHSSFIIHHSLRPLLLFLTTGLALAAIQFIPAAEYTLLSVRAEGAYNNMSGGFPLTDIIQILLPGQVSLYSPLYVGIVGLILALWVVFTAPNRHTTFWAIVALITLLISFGGNTFLYSPLYLSTPGFSIFRGQERWTFATAFSLSVLAGYGFNQLLITNPLDWPNYQLPNISKSKIQNPKSLTKYLFLFALFLTFLFFYGLNDTGWTPDSPFFNLLGASTLLTVLLALIWLLWKSSPHLHPAIFTAFTAALICFDLFSVNWQTNLYPQLPEWHTQMPAAVEAIKKDAAISPDEPYRVYNEFRLYDNYGVPYEIEDLWGASPLRPDRYDKFIAPPMPIERTWELLNVKYVITWRQELFVPSTIIHQEPAPDGATYVHRLNTVGPRAWLVTQTQIADDAAILQKITDPNFDLKHIALLEPDAAPYLIKYQIPITNQSRDLPQSKIQNLKSKIHLTTPTPALLILSEPYYPGWQATIDGQAAPLLRANYVFRAVPLPAGEHTIELIFRPLSFTIGAMISGVAVVVIVVTLILFYRRGIKLK